MPSSATVAPSNVRAALVVAHPGHELRVHGWLERARHVVFVLTDGSGGARASRLESTRRIVAAAGASLGSVFGRLSDRQLYEAVRSGDFALFTAMADEVSSSLAALEVDQVVSDAREGYNTGHDICRALVDAAVLMAGAERGRAIASFDFLLVGNPRDCDVPGSVRLALDDAALARKIGAGRGYAEMASEVESALQTFGAEAFRVECLRPVAPQSWVTPDGEMPFYERYGEQQVAAGLYTDVIRARDHVDPLVAALHRHARERAACSVSSSS
jgi:AcrR family transcriptional regulator